MYNKLVDMWKKQKQICREAPFTGAAPPLNFSTVDY